MTRGSIAGVTFATVLLVLAVVIGYLTLGQNTDPATTSAVSPSTAMGEAHASFLYGRITTASGDTHEGRLRWGRDQEAFWGDYFNGVKDANPWAAHVPSERLRTEPRPVEILGVEIARRARQINLGRPFMSRFGDIARIELVGRDVRVTLKSGTVFDLDFNSANDFDDGVRVCDTRQGVMDFGPGQVRSIDLLPAPAAGAVPDRLHGTVRTRQGDFTGFIQWNRKEALGSDELDGRTTDGALSLRFDTIRSIARHSDESSRVTLVDGREIVLSYTPEAGQGNLGIYVDDRRYGRVLISWGAFERLDFSPTGTGPAYDDFPPGTPLTGSVTTRTGRRLAGRLVYDLDESETTDTLDAPSQGVDYTSPFGLIASIVLPGRDERGARRVRVTLHNGEELELEQTGDLGEGNAGILIFVDGSQRPEYVPWTDVEQVDLHRPPSMYPPQGT